MKAVQILTVGALMLGSVAFIGCDKKSDQSTTTSSGTVPTTESVKNSASDAADKAKTGAENAGDKMKDAAKEAGDKVSAGAEKAKDATENALDKLKK